MKKIIILLLSAISQYAAHALEVSCATAMFRTDNGTPYIEVYSHFSAASVKFDKLLSGKRMAAVEVLYLWKKNGAVVKADKFSLSSPQVDSTATRPNFIDMKRYALPLGDYELEALFTDLNRPNNTYKNIQKVSFTAATDSVEISDIEPLSGINGSTDEQNPYYKYGNIAEPFVVNYYPNYITKILFLIEIYHVDKSLNGDCLVRYFIENTDGKSQSVDIFNTKRITAAGAVAPVVGSLDVQKLPSGNYNLVIEVRDRKLELVTTRKWFFQRSNPYLQMPEAELGKVPVLDMFTANLSKDSCAWSLSGLMVRLEPNEQPIAASLLKTGTLDDQRKYLFNYWTRRYPANAKASYQQYMAVITELDLAYTTNFRAGHLTDRGNIYLKYGKPNQIMLQEQELNAYPYEIWEYNKLSNTQSFAKFIFYNPSLAVNDFTLLHSTARGEMQDAQWQRKLYRDPQGSDRNFIDGTNVRPQMGSNRAGDLFKE